MDSPAASPVHSRSPSPFRPPSPLLFPEPSLPQSSELYSTGITQIPDVVISPPARSPTAEADSLPPSPLSFKGGHLSQFPTTGAEPLASDPSDRGSLVLGNARYSSESLRASNLAQFMNQPQYPPSFSQPYGSQVTVIHIPTVDASRNWSDGKRRSIGLMHSEQVSRYVNKGDV